MTKYVRVEQAPETLSREEVVINFPSFLEEVTKSVVRKPQMNVFGTHYTRALAEEIATKYEPDFDVFRNIKTYTMNDVPFVDNADIAKKMVDLFAHQYPKIFDCYIEAKIKAVPFGTKLIYYVGPHQYSGSFAKLGVDAIPLREVDSYMDRKSSEEKAEPTKKNQSKKS